MHPRESRRGCCTLWNESEMRRKDEVVTVKRETNLNCMYGSPHIQGDPAPFSSRKRPPSFYAPIPDTSD